MKRLVLITVGLFALALGGRAQVNMLSNPGFEIGIDGQRMMDSINSWTAETYPTWDWGRIRSAATTATHGGTNTFQLDAFANYNKVMSQTRPAAAGIVYEVEAYMKSPAGANYFQPTNGFCYTKIEFFNAGGTSLGAEDTIARFRSSGPTNWARFTTGPVLAPAGTATSKALFGYCPGGNDWAAGGDQNTAGFVYVDDVKAFTNVTHTAGALSNANFDVRTGTYLPLTNLPYWVGLGAQGGVVTNHFKGGNLSLMIWGIDSLAGQRWSATRGTKYASSAYIFSTNFTTTNAYGLVVLQYLNATNGVLVEYQSDHFTSLSPSNSWNNFFEAAGVAPSGTVYGRTLCGIVGSSSGFGSSMVWFDDASQRVVTATGTMAGLIHNGGFDDGPTGNAYDLDHVSDLPYWTWFGGTNAGYINRNYKTNEEQSLSITFPGNMIGQTFAAITGRNYIVEGYIYNPASEKMTGTAYGTLTLEFYNGTNFVSAVDSLHFTASSPSNAWVKFSVTNRAPWSGSVTGRVLCAVMGSGAGFGGALYFDGIKVTDAASSMANTQAGALWNPGFEYTSRGTVLGQIDNWSGLGSAGQVSELYKKSGNNALQIYFADNLAVQTWTATQGWRYATAGYLYTPTADRFASTANAHGVILLQFLNATSGVIATYESPWFTTNIAANVWTNFEAQGIAPAGTVSGRTVCAIVGATNGLGGSVWFDDMTQRVVSSTGTVSGLLHNPGFEDGPVGNAYDLDRTNDLPSWEWLGGTNAGFVNASYDYEGAQSLSITFPGNMAGQYFSAVTGRSYVVEGYIYNPAAEKFTGSAYGTLTLEFYRNGTLMSAVDSLHFTASSPSNTWVKFSVTNRAPSTGTVSARVDCAISGSGAGFGGALYFDGFTAWETNTVVSNVQAGALWNPGFEFSAIGTALGSLDNWAGFGQGTVLDTYKKSGNNALKMLMPDALAQQDWVATQGWKYASAAFAYTPAGDKMSGQSSVHASVLLQFLDAASNMLISYESPWLWTNATAGTWSNLETIGVAPKGTKYGRTIIGLFGATNGYSGSVWFDDATQRLVATTGTVSGLLRNPGFDDGPSGNAYRLYASNDLPNWAWIGGTNGGFIARDFERDNEQSLSITYPGNMVAQSFNAITGRNYVVEGYLFTPSSAKLAGSAYGVIAIEFYNGNYNKGTSVVSVAETLHFTSNNTADTWTKFSITNRAPWSGSITGRVVAGIFGSVSGYGGAVYFDSLSVTDVASSVANTQAGALWNPGFEYTAKGTVLEQIDNWSAIAAAGQISELYKKSGNNALQLYFKDTMAVQSWPATQGWRYATAGYLYTPASDRFTSTTNAHALVMLQFLNATSGVIASYESLWFTTNIAAGTWTNFEAQGLAPAGTVSGRTMCAIVGLTNGLGGSVWFDDLTQRVVSTTGTVSGLLHNPGFDDGPYGNAYDLQLSTNLPFWKWLGGTNAGFVTTSYRYDGSQAFSITFPSNLVAQTFAATTGRSYVVEGYIYNPSSEKLTGSAYGTLTLEFYQGGSLISAVDSLHFTSASPTNTWVKFSVTNRAPSTGVVSARVDCAVMGPLAGFGGALYFDGLTAWETNTVISNYQAGALWNPGFEYTIAGTPITMLDNWTGYGVGTVLDTYKKSGNNSLKIAYPDSVAQQDWVATQGWKYASAGFAYTPSSDKLAGAPSLHASVLLQFLDAASNLLIAYESPWMWTNATADSWSNLEAIGVAPKGTKYGRTLIGIFGLTNGFAGSVWFDDMTQRVVATTGTVSGLLRNPGFDDGPSGNAYNLQLTNDLPNWTWIGGTNAGYITGAYERDNEQSLSITYPGNMVAQTFNAVTGRNYVVEGYMYTPALTRMTGTAYGVITLEFYNGNYNKGTSVVSVVETAHFTSSSPSNTWVKFGVTNRAPWSGSITGRVVVAILGSGTGFGGALYFDSLSVTESLSSVANTQAGALWNPGFEYTADGTVLEQIDNWSAIATAGQISDLYSKSGNNALQIYFTETMSVQSWPATAGTRYATAGYLYTPSSGRFATTTNTHALIMLQYLNATSGVIASYESAWFTTNIAAGVWTNFEAQGVAPAGTVSGRTMCAIVGLTNGLGGSVWFDDMTQRVVSSTGTVSGLLRNPGFEDGIPGNAYDLQLSTNLPNWKWLGGTNAGFVTTTYDYEGSQSFSITFPSNLIGQTFAAVTGRSYVVEGYIYNPSTEKITNGAYGTLTLEFYRNGSLVSAVDSLHFTSASPTNTWVKFSVTNRAPSTGTVSARVDCAVMGPTVGYGGALYFDGLTAWETNTVISNYQAGALWNPGFEFTIAGTPITMLDNWTGYGVGTVLDTYKKSGNNSLRVAYPDSVAQQDWVATQGWKYASAGYAYTPSGDKLSGAANLHASVLLQFLDSASNILIAYESPWMWTNATVGAWSNLEAIGVAPKGTKYGRTLIGIFGSTNSFSGSVWFDDMTQRVVSTTGTISGVLRNPGFDDGPSGNAYNLQLTNDLPNWTWIGGTNAGYITGAYERDNEQSLSITYPGNMVAQTFNAVTGRNYVVEGYMYTPALTRMTGTAYGVITLEFYNGTYNKGTSVVSVVETAHFTSSSPTNTWVKFGVTNRAPWSGSITGRVVVAILGSASGFGGSLYFDSLSVTESLSSVANSQAGALWNPGFEYTADGTVLEQIDNWSAIGTAGQISDAYTRNGSSALQIYFTETMAAQSWTATQGTKYATAAYLYTPAGDRFATTTNTHGVVMLQYLNATGGVLVTYESPWFTTNVAAGTWTNFEAQGVAPAGTVSGRTLCAIVGLTNGFAGSIWFDDSTQRVMSTNGTISGLLHNPGFEDGIAGNAYNLQLTTNLPFWAWIGGTNAGFVTTGQKYEGAQSFSITFPSNLVGQTFAVATGRSYVVEGYIYNPSTEKITNGAYGTLTLEFYRNGTLISAVDSLHFTSASPTNTWVKFSVTNRAPSTGTVSARVDCAVMGPVAGYGGALYFDGLTAWETNTVVSNVQAGALWNPGFEFTIAGTPITMLDNWTGYGVGTVLDTYKKSGNNSLRVAYPDSVAQQDWVATQGWKYASAAFAYTPAGDKLSGASSLHASVLLQFLDAASNTLVSYESPWMWTNATVGAWSNLEAIGVAPKGTKYGRTLIGIFGLTNGFSGSVWFDDATQRVVATTSTVSGVLLNPGFDDGPSGNAYTLYASNDLPNWMWIGGTNGGFVARDYERDNEQALSITYPGNMVAQTFNAVTGRNYVVEGYMYTPALTRMTGTAYGVITLEFYNGNYNKGTSVVSVVETAHFTSSSPSNTWVKFGVTNRAPWSGSITGRVVAAILGSASGYGGAVYFDSLSVTESLSSVANTQAGALWNPGFEYTADGTVLEQIDNWSAIATAGQISDLYSKSGNNALQIYFTETMSVQSWPATSGTKYATAGYLYTPASGRFTTTTNTHALIMLQYLNATSGVIATYESAWFTTNIAAGVWTNFEAQGVAPAGTVSGRTMCAIVGLTNGFGGSVWFDDLTQRVVSSTGTVSGLLHNPGFDDGIPGNAYNLQLSTNLPFWTWIGGTNAGFITTGQKLDGAQSLSITFPSNLAGQTFAAVTGRSYVVEGYIYNPSTEKITNGAYGTLTLEFYQNGSLVSAVDSLHFTSASPTNTWVKFSVTNRAPSTGTVSARVDCAVMGPTVGYGGALYFDGLTAWETNTVISNYQAGALWNPGFEFSPVGTPLGSLDNWTGYGLGTVLDTYKKSGNNSLKLLLPDALAQQDWVATQGWKYASAAFAYTPSGDRISGQSSVHASVLLQFLDAASNMLISYESPWMWTNATVGAWSNLEAIGVAPKGTKYGRTIIGLFGVTNSYSGSVWFDDVTQRVVATTGTVSGVLRNPGFDDGPSGNAYNLQATNDLPNWTWIGGTNAGFIARDFKRDNEQALSITYPANMVAQTFNAVTGRDYVVEGYMYTPSSSRLAGSAYGVLILEFYNGNYNKGTSAVSVVETLHFTSNNTADTWTKFSVTNRAPWTGGVTGRVLAAVLGSVSNYGGAVYFDSLSVTDVASSVANTQAGALWNPGFEYTANGTILPQVDNWTNLGDQGGVWDTYAKSGSRALRISGVNALVQQLWDATSSWRYATAAFAYTPSGDRIAGTNIQAFVQLQFLDSTATNILAFYNSPFFTTNTPAGVWTNFEAQGVAPSGTRYGRTMFGVTGSGTNNSGSVWFDDTTQRLVSSTGTVAGLLHNPGFDDGPSGNAYNLQQSTNLPFWTWLGGTNAGFITTSYLYDGVQSLAIVYPSNLMAQSFAVTTGRVYTYDGYIYTPAASKLTGSAYGVLLMEFYKGTTLVSSVESAHFTSSSPSNSWVRFTVTNRAPWTGSGTLTSRVMCAIMGSTVSYGGSVCFDGQSVTETLLPLTNGQAGTLWNPGFEYTADGTTLGQIDNWTALGNAGMVVDDGYSKTGNNALKIYGPETLLVQTWNATQGWKYASSAFAYTPAANRLAGSSNLHGVVLLQFLDATGTNILATYESPWFRTNVAAGVWSNLEAIGVAPRGAVWGRTALALLGTNAGFGGALYFDDSTQRVVSTTGTVSGLLYNPGFDDGAPGNAYNLQATNGLPSWKWIGGTNAGFVARDYKKDNEQAFVVTYPLNAVAQDWTAGASKTYKAEGYLFTPSAAKFNSDGTCWGRIEMGFLVNGSTNVTTNFVSAKFDASQAANTWVYFAVTGTAPSAAAVTGRVSCTITAATNPSNDLDLAGVIYFDQLSLTEVSLSSTADVAVAGTDAPDPVRIGNALTYTLSVTNSGSGTAGNVVLTDVMPLSVNFVSCSMSQGSYEVIDDVVTCTIGTLANGATATVTLVVAPTVVGTITNQATVSSDATDGNTGNNRSNLVTTVLAQNRPPVIDVPAPMTLVVGSSTGFVVTVTDPDHDPSITLTNTVKPAGATFNGTNFAWTAGSSFAGTTNAIVFVANDNQGTTNSVVTNSTSIIVPFDWNTNGISDGWEWQNFGILTNSGAGDHDGDTMSDDAEYIAGTQPTNANSVFLVQSMSAMASTSNRSIRVATVPGRKYVIYYANNRTMTNNLQWTPFANTNVGVWIESSGVPTNHVFVDDEGTNTTGSTPAYNRYYKIKVRLP